MKPGISAGIIIFVATLCPGQTASEPHRFFQNEMGLSDEQIATISRGKPVVKVLPSKNPGEIIVFGAVYVDAAQRTRALAAALQLAPTAGNGRQAPPATVAAWLQQAIDLSRSLDNIELVLSHLGRWTHPESIRLLAPFLDRPEVKTQAASAILGAAGPVAEGPACAILKPLLDRIATMGNQGFTDRVANLRRALQATEARLPSQQVKP